MAGDINADLQVPSFIAPFLTEMNPSDRDLVLYYDNLQNGKTHLLLSLSLSLIKEVFFQEVNLWRNGTNI